MLTKSHENRGEPQRSDQDQERKQPQPNPSEVKAASREWTALYGQALRESRGFR